MTSSSLYRYAGIALVLGAILSGVGQVLNAVLFPGTSAPLPSQAGLMTIVGLLNVVGIMLALIGLPGIGTRVAHEGGGMGVLGFALVFFGGLLFAGLSLVFLVTFSWLSQIAPNSLNGAPPPILFALLLVASVLLGVGGLLLGISIMRTEAFPRAAGILLVVGAILNAASFPLEGTASTIVSTVGIVLFNVALGWIGYRLIQENRASLVRASVS